MTKLQAIHDFFSSFGLPAYEEHSVPAYQDAAQTVETAPPYITYQLAVSSFPGEPVAITADIWDLSESFTALEQYADRIRRKVVPFCRIVCDDGYILVTMGSPFTSYLADGDVKRAYMNLEFHFITN